MGRIRMFRHVIGVLDRARRYLLLTRLLLYQSIQVLGRVKEGWHPDSRYVLIVEELLPELHTIN